jgi:hypothetical protein
MSKQTQISLAVNKLDKSKFKKNEWTDKEGNKHTDIICSLTLTELNEPKFVKETEKATMKKVSWVEEGWFDDDAPSVGDGFRFDPKGDKQDPLAKGFEEDSIAPEDIPF